MASENLHTAVFEFLSATTGLDPDVVGRKNIAEAVDAVMRQTAVSRVDAFLDLLRASPDAREQLVERLVVPETWFFRDRECFRFLSKFAAARRTGTDKERLRILSVPCSTGEEPYSIVITLFEAGLGPDDFVVDAVDISRHAIGRAAGATYGKGSFRERDKEHLNRFFTPSQGGLKLIPDVTRCVHFHQDNFVQPGALAEHAPYTVIFCKNLLIYLTQGARMRVAANIERLLAPDGILFTGHAELVAMLQYGFKPVKHARSFACTRNDNVSASGQETIAKGTAGTETARRKAGNPPADKTPAAREETPLKAGEPEKRRGGASELDAIRELADRGNLEEASARCGHFCEHHPRSKDGHFLMGLIKLARNALTEAETCFQKTLYLDPRHYEALVHLSLLYETRGESAKASVLKERIRRFEAAGDKKEIA